MVFDTNLNTASFYMGSFSWEGFMSELARRFRIDGASFGPADPVVTEQFFKTGIRGGEERLMLAVLQDAVECFQENVLSQQPWEKKLFQEAENWVLAKNTDWLFSFENICETLQLHPDYIRRGLLIWKEAKRKSHSVEDQREDHTKLARTRRAPTAARLSKTGQLLMR
jgi:hypothetical protein